MGEHGYIEAPGSHESSFTHPTEETWFGPAEDPFAVTPFRSVGRALVAAGPQGVSARVFHRLALAAGYERGAADMNGAFNSGHPKRLGCFDRVNGRVYATHVLRKALADLTAQMEATTDEDID